MYTYFTQIKGSRQKNFLLANDQIKYKRFGQQNQCFVRVIKHIALGHENLNTFYMRIKN